MSNIIRPHNPLEGPRPELNLSLHDGSEERVSIIVVHKDRPEYAVICLNSLVVTSSNFNYEIILVDNASGKESQDFLDQIQDKVKVVRNEKNLYWGPAANRGVQAADRSSKYYIFMHDDVVITSPGWIDMMMNVAESQRSGMVGLERHHFYLQGQRADYIQEWCLLMTKECWQDCGPFPESVPQIGVSFITTMKAGFKGHNPQVMQNPVAHHYKNFSLNVSEFAQLVETANANLPKLVRELQAQMIK